MRPTLASCGKNLALSTLVRIYNPERLTVGDNVYIGHSTYIGDGDIRLHDEVVVGPFCSITAGNHRFRDGSVRFGGYDYAPVEIGRGTWLGAHVSVLSGVSIGAGCLVAAGSVVTSDVPDGRVVAGVPARDLGPNDPNSGLSSGEQYGRRS